MKWPLRYRMWRHANGITARLAWRFANPGGEAWGIALRIDDKRLLWRLNHWVGRRWIPWFMAEKLRRR